MSLEQLTLSDEQVQDIVASLITGGGGSDVVYDDTNDTLTVSLSDSISVNTLEADSLNNADVANAPAESVPKAQGDGTLSFASVGHVVVEGKGPLGTLEPDTWGSVASLTTERQSLAAAEANDLVYAIGGKDSSAADQTSVERYDPSTNTWTSVASLATKRNRVAAAEAGGQIYAIGGEDGGNNTLASVEEYDPSTNTWSSVASLTTERRNLAAAEADGQIYAIGGEDNADNTLASVEEYDPPTNTWSSVASLTTGRSKFDAAEAADIVYAIGGDGTNFSVEEYDPSTDTWSSVASLNTGRYNHAAAEADGQIYAISGFGGADGVNNQIKSVEKYDPSTDTWSSVASLNTVRRNSAATEADGQIYAIGGEDANFNTLRSVEELVFTLSPEDVFTATGDAIVGIDDPNGTLLNRTTGREVTNGTQLARDGEIIAAITSKQARVYRTEET